MMPVLSSLRPSGLAPNLLLGDDVTLSDDVDIGPNVVIHDGVTVEAGVRLEHGVVLGRVGYVGRRSRTSPPPAGSTLIESGAIICPFAIVDAGVRIGRHAFLGDRASLRAGVTVGVDASIGGGTVLNRGVEIGERVRTQTGCVIGPGVVIESEAFLGAGVHAVTGRTMGASPPKLPPILRRGCQVGSGALIMQGVEIGEEAVVGAGAVVLADVPPSTTVAGVPARQLGSGDDYAG